MPAMASTAVTTVVGRRVAPSAVVRRGANVARSSGFRPSSRPLRSRVAVRVSADGGAKKISQNEFTERAWEAIVLAPEIATNSQQQIVETEHLCKAMFEQKDSFALRILTQAGVDPSAAVGFIDRFISRQPKVSGGGQQVLGRHLEALVEEARVRRAAMGDDFVAVEHLVMAICKDERVGNALMAELGLNEDALKNAVIKLRGGTTVTDQGAEGKYESLNRYARDLTAEARAGKLDSVIGRDDEIKRAIQILKIGRASCRERV